MSFIDINPTELTNVITELEVSQMTVDLYTGNISFTVLLKDNTGTIIATKSCSPNQSDIDSFINMDSIDAFVLKSLNFSANLEK